MQKTISYQKIRQQFSLVAATLMIFLFLYTALNKLADHDTFRIILHKSPFIGDQANLFSWLIPGTEILVVLMLFIHRSRTIGLLISFLLMSVFTLYVAGMLLFSPTLPCSCGGIINQLSWDEHLILNIFFTLISYQGWQLQKSMEENLKNEERSNANRPPGFQPFSIKHTA